MKSHLWVGPKFCIPVSHSDAVMCALAQSLVCEELMVQCSFNCGYVEIVCYCALKCVHDYVMLEM